MSTQFSAMVGRLSATEKSELASALAEAASRSRLDDRDDAIRAVLRFYPSRRTRAAKSLSGDWARYLSTGFPHEKHLEKLAVASEQRRALHRLARTPGGTRALHWRQILKIADGRGRG
jgi:hypothetical protein